MPFETGALQNRSSFVKDKKKKKSATGKGTYVNKSDIDNFHVLVVSDQPYARRLYFHPEYNFSKEENPNAGAQWFEPYIHGEKKDKVIQTFARFALL